jgi:peptidoglycan/LPS O-acetylase OafA/YrhL
MAGAERSPLVVAKAEGSAEPGSSRYEPSIDGLRAVAVAAVLLFHSGFAWAKGGYLGVSLFFTLSGYLITTLVLDEIAATRRVDIGHFLVRRVRRLAPASFVVLALVALCAPWFAAAGQPLKFRGDLFAALGYVANWRFVLSHQSYADLFTGGPSPVLHYWSLAVEEQFYLVFPLVMAAAARAARWYRRRWIPVATVAALLVASVVAGLFTDDLDLGYYGSHVRAAEILVGALAAFAVGRVGRGRLALRPQPWVLLGGLGAAAFVWAVVALRRTEGLVLHGGLAALAVVWSVIIVGALVPGPLRRGLSTWPLVQLGRLSFGVYLYHWPVFLLLTPARLGVDGWALLGVRAAMTLALAVASFHLVEHPIRTRRLRLRTWRFGLAYAAVVAVAVVAVVVHLQPGPPTTFDAMLHAPGDVVAFDPSSTLPPPAAIPQEIAVVGSDRSVEREVAALAGASGSLVVDLTDPGCSVLDPGHACADPATRLRTYLAEGGSPDMVVVAVGEADHMWVGARLMGVLPQGELASVEEGNRIQAELAFLDAVRAAVPGSLPVQVVDAHVPAAGSVDPLPQWLHAAVLSSPDMVGLALTDLDASMYAPLGLQAAPAARRKVMVIGDSTSYGVAVDIDQLAGDRYEVVWAGARNCPLAPATEIHWWAGAQWTMTDCLAKQAQWPGLIDQFQPDVLLVVLSLPEHADQRYAGDATWYHAGDQRFTAEHEAAMQRLIDAVAPYGTRVLIADSEVTDDNPHLAAWNSLIATWPSRWPAVEVLPFGAAALAAEQQAGHSLRPDGIHFDDPTLLALVEAVYLPALA